MVSGRRARAQVVRADEAFAIDGQVGGLEALALQLLDRVQHGVVLDGGRDQVAAAPDRSEGGAADRQVVGLAAAGGEDDVVGARVEHGGDVAPGAVERFAGLAPLEVDAGRVAPDAFERRAHRLEDARVQRRRGRVVQVDSWSLCGHGIEVSTAVVGRRGAVYLSLTPSPQRREGSSAIGGHYRQLQRRRRTGLI